jgi:hypothetical protein
VQATGLEITHSSSTGPSGVPNPKPNIAYLRIYSCRAYPLIHKIPKKQKLRLRAQIGYLVGYDSSNIFRIWIPQDKKVIETRDVTFDESKKYDPDNLRPPLLERVEEPLQTIEFPDLELARGRNQRMKSLTRRLSHGNSSFFTLNIIYQTVLESQIFRDLTAERAFGYLDTIFLERKRLQAEKLFSPAIVNLSKLPVITNLNQPCSPSQHLFLSSPILGCHPRMRHPNDPHSSPSPSFHARQTILEN